MILEKSRALCSPKLLEPAPIQDGIDHPLPSGKVLCLCKVILHPREVHAGTLRPQPVRALYDGYHYPPKKLTNPSVSLPCMKPSLSAVSSVILH